MQQFLGFLICRLSRSKLVHCSISDMEIVLDVSLKGDLYYAHEAYMQFHPTLVDAFLVHGKPVTLDQYGGARAKKVWPTLYKTLTRGNTRSRDCLCVTRQILVDAGHDVPKNVISPAGLYRWLEQKGYPHASIRPRRHAEWYEPVAKAIGQAHAKR